MKNDLDKGIEMIEQSKYAEAFCLLLPIAKSGNSEAQAKIGMFYQLGLGVERNLTEAIYWLEKAAKQGNGEAAHNLGTLFLTCESDRADAKKSKEWYQKAKALGFIVAPDEWYK